MDTKTLYPPFLITLKIFNFNVQNHLVVSGAVVNVIPLSISEKTKTKWDKVDAQNIQLEKTHGHAIRELRDVIIHLSSDERFH